MMINVMVRLEKMILHFKERYLFKRNLIFYYLNTDNFIKIRNKKKKKKCAFLYILNSAYVFCAKLKKKG